MLIKRIYRISGRIRHLPRMNFAKLNITASKTLTNEIRSHEEVNMSEKLNLPNELMKFNNQKKNLEERQLTPTSSTADIDGNLDPVKRFLNELYDPAIKDEASRKAIENLYKRVIKGGVENSNSAENESIQPNTKQKIPGQLEINEKNKVHLDLSQYFISNTDNYFKKKVTSESQSVQLIENKGQTVPNKRITKKVKENANLAEEQDSNVESIPKIKVRRSTPRNMTMHIECNLVKKITTQHSNFEIIDGDGIAAYIKNRLDNAVTLRYINKDLENISPKKSVPKKSQTRIKSSENLQEVKPSPKKRATKLASPVNSQELEVVSSKKRQLKKTLFETANNNIEKLEVLLPKKRPSKTALTIELKGDSKKLPDKKRNTVASEQSLKASKINTKSVTTMNKVSMEVTSPKKVKANNKQAVMVANDAKQEVESPKKRSINSTNKTEVNKESTTQKKRIMKRSEIVSSELKLVKEVKPAPKKRVIKQEALEDSVSPKKKTMRSKSAPSNIELNSSLPSSLINLQKTTTNKQYSVENSAREKKVAVQSNEKVKLALKGISTSDTPQVVKKRISKVQLSQNGKTPQSDPSIQAVKNLEAKKSAKKSLKKDIEANEDRGPSNFSGSSENFQKELLDNGSSGKKKIVSKELNTEIEFQSILIMQDKGLEELIETIIAEHRFAGQFIKSSIFNRMIFNNYKIVFYSEVISVMLLNVPLFSLNCSKIELLCNKISGLVEILPKSAQMHNISIVYNIKHKNFNEGSLLVLFEDHQIASFIFARASSESLISLHVFTAMLVFALVEIIQSSVLEVISFSIISASAFRIDDMLKKNSKKLCWKVAAAIIDCKLRKYNQQRLSTESEGNVITREISLKKKKVLKFAFPTLRFLKELKLFKATFKQNFMISNKISRGDMKIKL